MSLEAEEAHCRERLAEIRLRCEQESKPWLDRLARIYACRPPCLYFVIPEVGSAAFQRMSVPKQDRPETFDDYGITIVPNGKPRP